VPLARKYLVLRGLVDSERSDKRISARNIGSPDRYQKKGVAGEAKRIVVKRRGLAKLCFAGAGSRGRDLGKQNETEPLLVTRQDSTGRNACQYFFAIGTSFETSTPFEIHVREVAKGGWRCKRLTRSLTAEEKAASEDWP